jgi:hypothetical protein
MNSITSKPFSRIVSRGFIFHPIEIFKISFKNRGDASMSEKKIDNIIHAYLKELSHQEINVEQIFLYGSQVRGTARIDSDIDLVVVSRDFANMTPAEKWQKLGRATLALNEPIEVLPYTPLELQSSLKRKGNFIRHILSQPEIMEYRP